MAPMTNSSPLAPAAPARSCYFVTFASAVHGGPVSEPIYATSPAEALATFNADGPAVQVLSVSGPDFAEYAVVNGEIVVTEIVDTEIVDTEIVDTEIVDTEIVDTEIVDTEIVDALACALQDPHLDATNRAQILNQIQRLATR